MAYQANRNNQNDNNDQPVKSKKQQNRENTKELAKDAGSLAMQAYGVPGPLADMAADKAAKNPLVNHALNKVSDKLHKNPVASKAINSVANSPQKDAAMGALGGKTGSSKKEAGNAIESGKNSLNKSNSIGKDNALSKKMSGNSKKSSQGEGNIKSAAQGFADIASKLKKIPPVVWPIIGWVLLIILGIMLILSVVSQFYPMFGVDPLSGQGGEKEYTANSEKEQAFYDRIDVVKKEYEDKGVKYEASYISATFSIMNRHDSNFTLEDMTETEIRNISELMFKESEVIITCEKEGESSKTVEGKKEEELSCPEGYTKNPDKTTVNFIFNESSFKNELASYMKSKLSLKDDIEVNEIVEEVFEYINNYKSFVYGEDSKTIIGNGNGSYWWPIGSSETTEVNGHLFATGNPATITITSYFPGRNNPITGKWEEAHGAIDIAGVEAGVGNVIASKDGIVERVVEGCMSFGSYSCGGGYGNNVILRHSDGNYTLYAHLHQNSITVKTGDIVTQGQVIANVGSSGNSTGAHLHFEVRVGQNSSSSRQDPLNFVDPKNPRPSTSASSNLIQFLHSFEGSGPASPDSNSYVVYDDGAGNLTVGYGVAIKYNLDRLSALGVDGNALRAGDLVPKSLVDQVEQQQIGVRYSNVTSLLSREGITLESYQIDALVSRSYNVGNVNGFPEMYKKYSNTQALYDNFMANPITASNGQVMPGLKKRREAEWTLFHTGVYKNNS